MNVWYILTSKKFWVLQIIFNALLSNVNSGWNKDHNIDYHQKEHRNRRNLAQDQRQLAVVPAQTYSHLCQRIFMPKNQGNQFKC